MSESQSTQNGNDFATRAASAKAYLRQLGMTQQEWADKNGFSRKHVSQILNGKRKGHYGKGHKIALALGLKGPVAGHAQNG